MFPPASPMSERIRMQNEMREIERRAARHTHTVPRRRLRVSLNNPMSLVARVAAVLTVVTTVTRTRTTAQDC